MAVCTSISNFLYVVLMIELYWLSDILTINERQQKDTSSQAARSHKVSFPH
ncbi:MAG: hypothetical protein KAK01_06525 [Candidatus Marinimicrobia bacterium]|nr:hypothetical protein [Candidatus Neomarinimicrobiota bacterium]